MKAGRISAKIRNALLGGISPRKLALTLAIGFVIGFLPVLWGATLLCAVLAYLFRLNQAVIQSANLLPYPVQIALFVPFYRIGARVFQREPTLFGEPLAKGFKFEMAGNVSLVMLATLKAVGVWLLIATPAAILLYLVIRPFLSRMLRVQSVNAGECDRLRLIDSVSSLNSL